MLNWCWNERGDVGVPIAAPTAERRRYSVYHVVVLVAHVREACRPAFYERLPRLFSLDWDEHAPQTAAAGSCARPNLSFFRDLM
jgi:hypothetical protein